MVGEDVMGKIFSCMGEKDDTVAKGLLAGKVRRVPPTTICLVCVVPLFVYNSV